MENQSSWIHSVAEPRLITLPHQVGFAPCTASQNTEVPRFAAERMYSQGRQARKRKNKPQTRLPEGKRLGVLWDDE